MTFHVSLTNAEKLDYADEDVYEFPEGGVLAIYRGEAFMDEYLAPTAWERVEASKGHKPGRKGHGHSGPKESRATFV